ncbi:MAG: hypothetical protein KF832_12605 [Caldilineaceae bacterium]|nr:hypothetical protein [Caldilineaceae bacterium]
MWIFKNGCWLYQEADKGTASGEGNDTDDATGTNGGEEKPFATFQTEAEFQSALETKLKDRLERERKKADEKARKAAEDAETKVLAEQEKFQELAEKRSQQLSDLEATTADLTSQLEHAQEKVTRYEKALGSLLAEQRKLVPAHVHDLLDNLDPAAQLEWIAANSSKLAAQAGIPATPKQQSHLSAVAQEKAQQEAARFAHRKF